MYQYIGVTATDQNKAYYANEFAKYLTSEKVQNKLYKIGMLSVDYSPEQEITDLNTLQSVSCQKTLSLFTAPEILEELKVIAKDAIFGNEDAKRKIKNILILS